MTETSGREKVLEEAERQRFEEWSVKELGFVRPYSFEKYVNTGEYTSKRTFAAWAAWRHALASPPTQEPALRGGKAGGE